MAANTDPIFGAVAHSGGAQFVNADGTTKKTLFAAGTNGSRIDSISACSNDSAVVELGVYLNDGSADHYLGNIHLAIGAGYTTVAKADGITALMPTALPYLDLPTGWSIKVAPAGAVTTAKVVDIIAIGKDY